MITHLSSPKVQVSTFDHFLAKSVRHQTRLDVKLRLLDVGIRPVVPIDLDRSEKGTN